MSLVPLTAKDLGEKFSYAIFGELRLLDFYGRLNRVPMKTKQSTKDIPRSRWPTHPLCMRKGIDKRTHDSYPNKER